MKAPVASSGESRQREKIATTIVADSEAACAALAQEIAALIRERSAAGRTAVLGLATGSTPVRLYRQLVRLHREESLSFRSVVTFNLDEYYGLPRSHPESYWRFMHEQLFAHVDIPAANINLPDGLVPRGAVFAACQAYEEKIVAAGGIDLQVLGVGRTGHVGFNEPGSSRDSRTRLVTLDALTRRDAARDFLGEAKVPRHAITMGIGTIWDARRVVLLAWGEAKATVIARAVEGPATDALPASLLQEHPCTSFIVDRPAAAQLTRVKFPWLVGPVDWSPSLVRRAVVWLARHVKKPVLKLVDEDYAENGMAELLTEQGPAYSLNIRIFNELQHMITGWPGGKPDADDRFRPERASPFPKRVLVLSPEPSDDMLGMGATLRRLIEQGHDVTVAYETSGSLGVPDEEAALAAELVLELEGRGAEGGVVALQAMAQLARKGDDSDGSQLRRLKAVLRRSEARAALRGSGLDLSRVRFLDLPFYENGRYRQFRPSEPDIERVVTLLAELRPHQVFATGHDSDPLSVSAVSYALLEGALQRLRDADWRRSCRVWLYRPPERDWPIAEIDMAVPLSPRELAEKMQAIYHHKSQRSQSAVLAAGLHEPWQQAEHVNRGIAQAFDALGLAEYEAIEAFSLHKE
jgi:glucosamine-6-phosphate deaminase